MNNGLVRLLFYSPSQGQRGVMFFCPHRNTTDHRNYGHEERRAGGSVVALSVCPTVQLTNCNIEIKQVRRTVDALAQRGDEGRGKLR